MIPDGSKIDVTAENFAEYLVAQVTWRLGGGFKNLLEHFIRGMYGLMTITSGVNDIVPLPLLNLFTANELKLMVCGGECDQCC